MKNYLFMTLLFTSLSVCAQTTTFQYDLKVSGNTVGTLTVSKVMQGNKKTYTSDSESEVHLFGKTTIKTHQEAIYINGDLENSLNQVWKDGILYDETKVEKNGSGYVVTRKGTTSSINQTIDYSSIRLYFHPPASVNESFSETEGVFKSITSIGNDTYQLADDGNHVNRYIYNNGVLEEAIINHKFFNILLLIKK